MKHQAFNPYLPSFEYVPDGEPRLFGDRVYVYGSHDAFAGPDFCVNDYVCWSAPKDDLGDWRFEGVIYRAAQDPLNAKGNQHMNAPDCVQGPDGRYYLYYQLHLDTGCSVAVAERPEGPYSYYGRVAYPDGKDYSKKKGDSYAFDPGVLVDDDGRVYLYVGFSPDKGFIRTMMKMRGGSLDGGNVVELEQDMKTVKGPTIPTIPGAIFTKGTPYEGHGFFEASSVRKFGGRYYLTYSSILSHELCYAISDSPVGPWTYGGTLVSIGDIGLNGNTEAVNYLGNTHGGMLEIGNQHYIFYHRQTNKQKCCRQGCAEPITIGADGRIAQAEITSCGLNGGPLPGSGTYEARIACNLGYSKPTFAYLATREKDTEHPFFTQTGSDREKDPDQYIANMGDFAWCGFKYFTFDGEKRISVVIRGNAFGKLIVSTEKGGEAVASMIVKASADWTEIAAEMQPLSGTKAIYFRFEGRGAIDFKEFTLKK